MICHSLSVKLFNSAVKKGKNNMQKAGYYVKKKVGKSEAQSLVCIYWP